MKNRLIRSAAGILLALTLTLCARGAGEQVVAGGQPVGLSLETRGVCVADLSHEAPRRAGLQPGDLILRADGREILTAQDLTEAVEAAGGAPLRLTVSREGKERQVLLAPHRTPEGWRLGIFVRDQVTGIGTVTYYEPETGAFGALGHGVHQGNTLLPLRQGSIVPAEVTRIVPGQTGSAGTLRGRPLEGEPGGRILRNTPGGIFGTLSRPPRGPVLEVGAAELVRKGEATIFSTVEGREPRAYSIRITALSPSDPQGRNLTIEVTDPALLSRTGGIVQGMSGSPILQDGKLIGAVTHVLLEDPSRGYGIFIENMLEAAG